MGLHKGQVNAIGNSGGKSLNDRKLASEVRTLTLKKIKAALTDEENKKYSDEFQMQLLLRLSGTVLPRLNEHTGEDGGDITIKIAKEVAEKNEINKLSSNNS